MKRIFDKLDHIEKRNKRKSEYSILAEAINRSEIENLLIMPGFKKLSNRDFIDNLLPLISNGIKLSNLENIIDKADKLLFTAIASKKIEVIEKLLKAGLDPNVSISALEVEGCEHEEGVSTALKKALADDYMEGILALLEAGADPNIYDKYCDGPLNQAVIDEDKELLSAFIKAGANPNIRDQKGFTPLHEAIDTKNIEIILILLSSEIINPNIQDEEGKTALYRAVESQDMKAIYILLRSKKVDINECDNAGITPLHLAVINRNVDIVLALLEAGADPNIPDSNGCSPLYGAVSSGNMQLILTLLSAEKISNKKIKIDTNIRTAEGNTPLHLAVMGRNIKTILALLKAGADPNIQNNKGDIVLHEIMRDRGQDIEEDVEQIVHILLSPELGIDVNIENLQGRTPLHEAIRRRKIPLLRILLKEDIDDSIKGKELHYAIEVEEDIKIPSLLLQFSPIDVNIKDGAGNTVLHKAALSKSMNMNLVLDLLKAGANPNIQNNQGNSSIYRIIKRINGLLENLERVNPRINTNSDFYIAEKKEAANVLSALLEVGRNISLQPIAKTMDSMISLFIQNDRKGKWLQKAPQDKQIKVILNLLKVENLDRKMELERMLENNDRRRILTLLSSLEDEPVQIPISHNIIRYNNKSQDKGKDRE